MSVSSSSSSTSAAAARAAESRREKRRCCVRCEGGTGAGIGMGMTGATDAAAAAAGGAGGAALKMLLLGGGALPMPLRKDMDIGGRPSRPGAGMGTGCGAALRPVGGFFFTCGWLIINVGG
jgi:hypothetical protein